ncbi:MAG: SurA N-terminal domain-containing protein [Pseudomonadota bacterium]
MLQNIRNNVQGPAVKVVVWLIVIAFAAFGIENILLGGSSNSVAEVNGEPISPFELQQSINSQKRQLISVLGDELDPTLLDDDRLRGPALENLIGRKLVLQSAMDMGLDISDGELGQLIADMEQFQIDGQFSPDAYRSVLSSAGFTPASFKQTLKEDMLNMQIRSSLGGSEFVTPQEMELSARLATEQRDLRYLTIPIEQFRRALSPGEDEVVAFYEANQSKYMLPETVDLEYLLIDPEAYRSPVEEAVLLEEYEVETSDVRYQTESRVSHILFEQGGESDEAFAARILAAQEAIDAGTAFADAASEFSDDIGSASVGGDLGFTSGETFPAEMEAAISALQLDEVSGPVVTDAGTHLLLVTERRAGDKPSLEELREELTDRAQMRAARDQAVRTADQLRDLAFNASDLSTPATELGLDLLSATGVSRNQAEGLFSAAALRDQAFSDDVLENGYNSEVIELPGNRFVALRVAQYNEAAPQPLAAVRDDIVRQLGEAAAREALVVKAERALVALRGGQSVEAFATESGYAWQVELGARRANGTVPREVLARVFELPAPEPGSTSFDYVTGSNGDVLVLELDRVSPGDSDTLAGPAVDGLRNQLSAEQGGLLLGEYERGLREAADISRL